MKRTSRRTDVGDTGIEAILDELLHSHLEVNDNLTGRDVVDRRPVDCLDRVRCHLGRGWKGSSINVSCVAVSYRSCQIEAQMTPASTLDWMTKKCRLELETKTAPP